MPCASVKISYVRKHFVQENVPRQFCWRLVHGDVFRPPGGRLLLAVLVGSGMQIFCTTLCALVLYVINILHPIDREAHEIAIFVRHF